MGAEGPVVVGLGEILWDLLPSGKQLGGAPANFAYHAHAMGASGAVISRVGDDLLGREILTALRELRVPVDGIQVDRRHPTGTVSVSLDADGHPSYRIHEGVAWDHLRAGATALALAARARAICFGSLAQRCAASRRAVRTILRAAGEFCLRVFDVNLRQNYYSPRLIADSLRLATVLKINDEEAAAVVQMLSPGADVRTGLEHLLTRFGLRLVALTKGCGGSLLLCPGGVSDHPGYRAQVEDTVGAGDAFTAAMTLGLLRGWGLDRINEHANRVAAYVCSRRGATPPLPEALRTV